MGIPIPGMLISNSFYVIHTTFSVDQFTRMIPSQRSSWGHVYLWPPHDSPLCADLRPRNGGGSHIMQMSKEGIRHFQNRSVPPPSTVMPPSSMRMGKKLLPGAPASVIRVHSSNRVCWAHLVNP